MKRLIVMIVLLAGAWSGYWFYASGQKRAAIEDWFTEKQEEGWQASYEDLSIAGFPNRVDATLDNPSVENQDGSIAWNAPFLQLLSLVYNPSHVIVIWPQTQTFITPYGTVALRKEDLRASVVFDGDDASSLNRFSLVGEDMEARTERGSWEAAELRLAAERLPGAVSDYRVALATADMTVDLPLIGAGSLPNRIEKLDVDTHISFEHAWDAKSLLFDRPKPTSLEIVAADIEWGPATLTAKGLLELDETGTPEGEIDFSLKNWEEMIGDIANSGAMSHQQAESMRMMIGMMASSSGDPRAFDATLTFSGGMMRLGQLPIGPAPRFSPH
ncbi:MAG: DUF2125 domain-containing protein [Donghicola eburneus]|nr:DUF2125 domain-containing protein [Donghicola eburneus]MCI5042510.1 DUF2125 domain-containing protein [Donghicola eburneus]